MHFCNFNTRVKQLEIQRTVCSHRQSLPSTAFHYVSYSTFYVFLSKEIFPFVLVIISITVAGDMNTVLHIHTPSSNWPVF
jgi:hypothetical protein